MYMKQKIFSLLALLMTAVTASAQAPTYNLAKATGADAHGTIRFDVGEDANKKEDVSVAKEGELVTVTVTPDPGYVVNVVTGEWSAITAAARSQRRSSSETIPTEDAITLTPGTEDPTTGAKTYTFRMIRADAKIGCKYKKLLTVKADDIRVSYGTAKPNYTASYDGFTDGDDASCLGGTLAFACNYTTSSKPGSTFTITPSGYTSDKYEFVYQTGTLTVRSGSIIVVASGWEGEYDGEPHSISIFATSGSTIKYRTSPDATYSKNKPAFTKVGSYIVYYMVTKTNYTTVTGSKRVIINSASIAYTGGEITQDENGYDISLTEGGGSPDPLPVSGTVDDLDYSRTLAVPGTGAGDKTIDGQEANLFTVCLPFVLSTGTGVTCYTLSGISSTTLDFIAVEDDKLAAFTPYLVSVTGDSDFTLSCEDVTFDTNEPVITTTVQGDAGNFTFTGTLTGLTNAQAAEAAGEGHVTYILQSGGNWSKVKSATDEQRKAFIPPFRAFITGPDVSESAGARVLGCDLVIEEATGIDSIRTTDLDGTERWYDLNGRRIDKPTQKGVYIQNDNKIVVK